MNKKKQRRKDAAAKRIATLLERARKDGYVNDGQRESIIDSHGQGMTDKEILEIAKKNLATQFLELTGRSYHIPGEVSCEQS